MKAPCEATLLRIFIGDDDTYDEKPLADQLILKARAMDMAGATVLRGSLAYGPASKEMQIVLRLSEDRPIVIEMVDSDDKIAAFLDAIDGMIDCGLVTTQAVSVRRYGRKQP